MSHSVPTILLYTHKYVLFTSQKEYILLEHSISRRIGTQHITLTFVLQINSFELKKIINKHKNNSYDGLQSI